MDRMEEYNMLLNELGNTPRAVDDTVVRAKARLKSRSRFYRFFTFPASSLAAFFIAFVIAVNLSVPFARACGRLPLLQKLAEAVAFSPSLSAAVENEYVQPVGLEKTVNKITMRVEYVIVDQMQLNIFYTLNSPVYTNMDAAPSISLANGTPLNGYSIAGGCNAKNGGLCCFTVDFADGNMPEGIILTCKVRGKGGDYASAPTMADTVSKPEEYAGTEPASVFTFSLAFDPYFTSKGEIITLNKSFILGGQRLKATEVEIYPTHVRLNLEDDKGDTAWLKSLVYYLEDEKGNRFERISNGVIATGSADSPMMNSFRLESSFFSKSKKLTLYITGAVLLDKNMERVKVDLAHKAASALPEGVTFDEAVRKGGGWDLAFSGIYHKKDEFYQLFYTDYYDGDGKKRSYEGFSSTTARFWDKKTQKYVEKPDAFQVCFKLTDYPYDTVYLCPAFSRVVTLDQPVVIKVK
ncbi:MAG: DUF4179 domain-containing protein [Bacillota bacterium]|nr:DUF4179 domain-containing protein [Bacillota bacterium]